LRGSGSSVAYAASKGALNTMTLGLAHALGPEIRINAICPGFFESRWLMTGLGDNYDNVKSKIRDMSALKRTAVPEDMAEVAVWLIEGAGYVTGQIIPVEGGHTITSGAAVRPKN
ncbi:MAG: SDR family oxidoreductase, partial [Alphaproteobacteria bacterium]|nr:SDR family oxidoreductase [Alphaproteobacteria bacterium]